MTITISIDGEDNEAIAALIYEYYRKQGYKVRLCRRPDHKPIHEIKRFYNLCNHEIALLHALDQSLTSYKMWDWEDYDIVVWQGSIITDYIDLVDKNTPRLFVKQINRFTPKMDYYYYIEPAKIGLKNNLLDEFKNLIVLNGEDDINTLYKTVINHLNESYPHCKWCNHIYKKDYSHRKYCSKTCSELSREKQNRDNSYKYYRKYGRKTSNAKYNSQIGSYASLTQHPQENFEKEHETILNEKLRLRI